MSNAVIDSAAEMFLRQNAAPADVLADAYAAITAAKADPSIFLAACQAAREAGMSMLDYERTLTPTEFALVGYSREAYGRAVSAAPDSCRVVDDAREMGPHQDDFCTACGRLVLCEMLDDGVCADCLARDQAHDAPVTLAAEARS